MIKIKSSRAYISVPGVSLVELMVALTLMAVTATAAFQIMSLAETTLFGSRNEFTNQQREEAVGSFIYEEFLSDNISLTSADNYSNDSALPDNLDDVEMTIVPIFGNGGRYDGANPRCTLTAAADLVASSFSFAADCSLPGTSPTLAERMNGVTSRGAKATLAIINAGGRCTISRPIVNAGAGMTATAIVDDVNCLQNGSGTAAPSG